ncbi:MAG: hypothetical protein ABIO94_04770 [Opitutaceae bacterium]
MPPVLSLVLAVFLAGWGAFWAFIPSSHRWVQPYRVGPHPNRRLKFMRVNGYVMMVCGIILVIGAMEKL